MPRRRNPSPLTLLAGVRLRELRLERGMSIDQLAAAAHTSKGHLSDIEHGFIALTVSTIGKLAVALDLPPFYFLTFAENGSLEDVVELMRKLPQNEHHGLATALRRGALA